MSTAIIAITTSNSINVNPARTERFFDMRHQKNAPEAGKRREELNAGSLRRALASAIARGIVYAKAEPVRCRILCVLRKRFCGSGLRDWAGARAGVRLSRECQWFQQSLP